MYGSANEILKKSIQYIKGVGEKRARLFHRLGIYSVEDIITCFPRDFEDRDKQKRICELLDGEKAAFEGVVISQVTQRCIRPGLTIYKAQIADDTGTITGTWYNQSFIKRVLKEGEQYIFYGKIKKKFGYSEISSPICERADREQYKSLMKIMPVYPSTTGLSQNVFRSVMQNALDLTVGKLEEILPAWVRKEYCLSDINYAFSNIHFPKSETDLNNARYRLVFEELFILQLGLLQIKTSFSDGKEGIRFRGCSKEISKLISGLGFELTGAQKKVWGEIKKNMEEPKIMNRLIQGDVGSGKTIIGVLALLKAVKSGYQGVMMAPTEILAKQHFESLTSLMARHGVCVDLLIGSQPAKNRKDVLLKIESGQVDVVVGTHALIQDNVKFYRLGLVITDEQHRFGVRQRAALSDKGKNPDVLVMTATPIPRTLALILYGDLDISIIDELPAGRKPIKTYAVDGSMRDRINEFIRKNVLEGRQIYIVCPLIEESDAIEAKSAQELAQKIAREDFKDLRVGLVHGKMSPGDKEDVMLDFAQGEIDILVSTTVIEVGIDIPNATVMVIENAERFGLAQLHQLRGRVGRAGHQSYCIMYNEGKSRLSKERMRVMEGSTDGFVISEKDLWLRGPGEFFGTRQHGLPDLKIANLYKDIDVLKKAQEAVEKLLKGDEFLHKKENLELKKRINDKFQKRFEQISPN
ncbi:MAG: ATP-dependent DNA helicase RecG [Clostridium sp.]|nr:ATP-dependent DNA helicase RecG [Clostridium sp.]